MAPLARPRSQLTLRSPSYFKQAESAELLRQKTPHHVLMAQRKSCGAVTIYARTARIQDRCVGEGASALGTTQVLSEAYTEAHTEQRPGDPKRQTPLRPAHR